MTRRRQTSPFTPSLGGQNERTHHHMTNKKKNTPAQRLGAAALATATVVSGLAFGPGAVAAPSAERGTTVTSTTSENAEQFQDFALKERVCNALHVVLRGVSRCGQSFQNLDQAWHYRTELVSDTILVILSFVGLAKTYDKVQAAYQNAVVPVL